MKRIVSVLIAVILILTAAFASAEGIQKAYYNDDYAYLGDADSVYVSLTLEEAYYLFQQEGNYLILLGGSWCGNTTPVIGYINEVAKEYGVSTIYNLDFRLDGARSAVTGGPDPRQQLQLPLRRDRVPLADEPERLCGV